MQESVAFFVFSISQFSDTIGLIFSVNVVSGENLTLQYFTTAHFLYILWSSTRWNTWWAKTSQNLRSIKNSLDIQTVNRRNYRPDVFNQRVKLENFSGIESSYKASFDCFFYPTAA